MIRVGFIGTPGSGKTSTARALASQCRRIDALNNVEIVSEYARRYISKHGSIDFLWEQYRILHKQLEWETSVENDNLDLLITDSPIFVGFAYCLDLREKLECIDALPTPEGRGILVVSPKGLRAQPPALAVL